MESHDLRKIALKAIDDTTFYPKKGRERIRSMIETRPDWCVSRQRVWGVPLPIFISKKNGEILIDEKVFDNIAKIFEKEGSDCWFSDDPQKFLGTKYKSSDYEKLSDQFLNLLHSLMKLPKFSKYQPHIFLKYLQVQLHFQEI